MRVRLGHIQENLAQGVWGLDSPCAVLRQILSKRGILGTAEPSRCLRQKQAKRSRGSGGDRIQWMIQGAAAGAALQFSQGRSAARWENWLSARGTRSAFCKGATTPAAKAGNRNHMDFCRATARRNGFPLKAVRPPAPASGCSRHRWTPAPSGCRPQWGTR